MAYRIIRDGINTTIPIPDKKVLTNLALAWQLLGAGPVDCYQLQKITDIESFCRLVYGPEMTDSSFNEVTKRGVPKLSQEEEVLATMHRHGIGGVCQQKGEDLLKQIRHELTTLDPEFKDIWLDRFKVDWQQCTVLRRIVTSHRYDTNNDSPIPEYLAKAYYIFGQATATGNENCSRKKQGAIEAVATILWGVNAWKQCLRAVEASADDPMQIAHPLLSPTSQGESDRLSNARESCREGALFNAAGMYVNRATSKIRETDAELAEILSWNGFGDGT